MSFKSQLNWYFYLCASKFWLLRQGCKKNILQLDKTAIHYEHEHAVHMVVEVSCNGYGKDNEAKSKLVGWQ